MRFSTLFFLSIIAPFANAASLAPRKGFGVCLSFTSTEEGTIQLIKCITGDCQIKAENTLSITDDSDENREFTVGLGVSACN
ncbi:hypothetical protein BC629DRAFT_371424 [Irpex lacteus]|nr:hypothetical protein BC629DRAFT_371424 [Irpex lacteus]